MDIIEEKDFIQTYEVFDILLENGVLIHAKADGTALGEDGKKYFNVSSLDEEENVIINGWTTESESPVYL